jgi:hypothetical protein
MKVLIKYTHVPQDPLILMTNFFYELFQIDNYKLMNVCNQHVCDPTCYKIDIDSSKKCCKYGFPQPLINETHFDIETRLLHIKITNKWLNNTNPWILSTLRCNHDLKFITSSRKDSKSLIYYITSIYISHMYSLLQITLQHILGFTIG